MAKMRESIIIIIIIMEDQDELLIRKSEYEEVDLETNNNKAVLELEDVGLGQNADLCRYCQSRGQHAKLGAWPWPALSFGQRQMMKMKL